MSCWTRPIGSGGGRSGARHGFPRLDRDGKPMPGPKAELADAEPASDGHCGYRSTLRPVPESRGPVREHGPA